ncbi:S-adenosyl-L-methionine-dependent methyltransferase [Xylariaceae sp. FL1651]|nr:S-adenosyl-L-methionine-dependent methyltransferase [Xylariaceae sp. FL1651]
MIFKTEDALGLVEGLESLLEDPDFDPETLDRATRRRLSEAARKLSLATEATGDTVHRIAHMPFQLPLALIGLESGLLDILADLKGAAISSAELSRRTDVDPALLERLLRYYQSFGIISQLNDGQYCANNITRALVSLSGRSALPFIFATVVPAINAMPQFLRENGYVNMTDPYHIPWHLAHGTEDPIFKWINARPDVLKNFMRWMAGQRDGLPNFLSVVDFEEEFAKGAGSSTPVFVDVGGSLGHQCAALKQRHPNLVGRVVLQDLPETIAKAKKIPPLGFVGGCFQAHDFFTPQPIHGARAYYLRNVLHDWPDEKCIEILRNIMPAMTSESRILIDEMILPEKGAPWRATQQDFIMGACIAAQERSHDEWLALFDRAGLKVERFWKYTEELSDYLMVLVPK